MQVHELAQSTVDATRRIPAGFMLAPETYAHAATLGFSGMDFYFAGRGGVLGEVDADVVSASFAFFNPEVVRGAWERSADVLPRAEAAAEFAACAARWAVEHLPSDCDYARVTELLDVVTASADSAGAPLFAGWRAVAAPEEPAAAALLALNEFRELRGAKHAIAVLSKGIRPEDAVRYRSPQMAELFGWPAPMTDAEKAELEPHWLAAEALTDELFAPALGALSPADQAELTTLLADLHTALK